MKFAEIFESKWPFKNKNKIYNLMIREIDCGPFDGGCVVFAQALQKKYGGQIVVLIGDRPTGQTAEHAALLLNNILIDADGPAEPKIFIQRFVKNEFYRWPIINIRPIREDDLPEAPRNQTLANMIAKLL